MRPAPGQQMVRLLKSRGVAVRPLTKAQIRNGDNGATLGGLTAAQRDAFVSKTPLWFKIVRDPAFRPTLGPDNTTFRMVDLLLFAFEGMKNLLAPLG